MGTFILQTCEKRKALVDEMAITMQQKTDESANTVSELQQKLDEMEKEAEVC